MVIAPSIGRVVWYYKNIGQSQTGQQPYAALVAYVHSDRCVNLAWFDANGEQHSATSVVLVQEGDAVPAYSHCTWMPFQLAQAKKAT